MISLRQLLSTDCRRENRGDCCGRLKSMKLSSGQCRVWLWMLGRVRVSCCSWRRCRLWNHRVWLWTLSRIESVRTCYNFFSIITQRLGTVTARWKTDPVPTPVTAVKGLVATPRGSSDDCFQMVAFRLWARKTCVVYWPRVVTAW